MKVRMLRIIAMNKLERTNGNVKSVLSYLERWKN